MLDGRALPELDLMNRVGLETHRDGGVVLTCSASGAYVDPRFGPRAVIEQLVLRDPLGDGSISETRVFARPMDKYGAYDGVLKSKSGLW